MRRSVDAGFRFLVEGHEARVVDRARHCSAPGSFVNAPFRARNVPNVTVAERRAETRSTLSRALSHSAEKNRPARRLVS